MEPIATAHPRVSGENYGLRASHGAHPGSSPRERGKPAARAASQIATGLIPA